MRTYRPKSASASSSVSRSKPKMRTLYKDLRNNTLLSHESFNKGTQAQEFFRDYSKTNNEPRLLSARASSAGKIQKQNRSFNLPEELSETLKDSSDNEFRKSCMKITKELYKNHDSGNCVCSECTCGRHLCKFHPSGLNLTKRSTYDQDYNKRKTAYPNKCFIASQQKRGQMPNFQPNSSYYHDYPGKKNDDLSRPKPQDNLQTGGPSPNLTSYSSEFPGHRGANQYIKPTDKHRRERFPLRGKTTYGSSFLGKSQEKNELEKMQDNLQTGSTWFGESSYNNFFKNPNPESYAPHYKHRERYNESPNYKHQFQTSYGDNFIKHKNGECPAKLSLERKRKQQLSSSKLDFKDNFDFKGMSHIF